MKTNGCWCTLFPVKRSMFQAAAAASCSKFTHLQKPGSRSRWLETSPPGACRGSPRADGIIQFIPVPVGHAAEGGRRHLDQMLNTLEVSRLHSELLGSVLSLKQFTVHTSQNGTMTTFSVILTLRLASKSWYSYRTLLMLSDQKRSEALVAALLISCRAVRRGHC